MADLKVAQVIRDAKGVATGEVIPYATKVAVITDMEAEASEVIRVDIVRITGMTVTFLEGVFQANFMIGGLDSSGNFQVSPAQLPALFSVNKSQNESWWAENIEGRTIFDFDEVLKWIHESGAVRQAGESIWKMPDLVDYYPGEVPQPQPPPPPASETIPGVIPPPWTPPPPGTPISPPPG